MKFTCSKTDLLHGLQIVQRAVAARSTNPILTGIFLEAQSDKLIFRSTDQELLIQYELPLQPESTGQALLPARYLVDLVRRLPNMEITIEQKLPDQLYIFRYGNSEVQLIGMDPEEFPRLPGAEYETEFQLQGFAFQNMIRQVNTAAAIDSMRPIFTGIFLEIEDEKLNMVATDTHRLAFSSVKLPAGEEITPTSLVIPTKTLLEITRLIEDEEENINVQIGANQVFFQIGRIQIITRIIEGKFPNYRQVIPDNHLTRIKVSTKLLLEGVDRATLMAQNSGKLHTSVLKITAEGNTLILEAKSQEVGQVYEEIPIYLEGEPIEINFNGRYLLDGLRVIDTDEVYFDLTGAISPGIFRPGDGRDNLYLVLPVRTTN